MKRGPQPAKGFDAAIPAALRRGRVMHFRASPAYEAGFLINGNGLVVLVCLRLATRLTRATIAEIGAEFNNAITGLSTFPCGGPVCRELWLYSRYGALRFFRVRPDGSLEEIDRDGLPFVNGKPAGVVLPVPETAGPAVPAPVPGVRTGPGTAGAPCHVIRWLKKWNAMKNAGATGCANPEEIPGSGSPAPAAGTGVPVTGQASPPDPAPAGAGDRSHPPREPACSPGS